MSAPANIAHTARLNYLNIGLIVLSCVAAYRIPFELFLVVYAIFGPAHYLTEISWLHERKYFSSGKIDPILLGLAALLLFVFGYVTPRLQIFDAATNSHFQIVVVYLAFVGSLAMVLLKKTLPRFFAFLVIILAVGVTRHPSVVLFFSVFLPTLVHIFVFTGLFMLYGALKSRSVSGYLAVLSLVAVPFLFLFFAPDAAPLSTYAIARYPMFQALNIETMALFDVSIFRQFDPPLAAVYQSRIGVTIMRFIAFAYTYHYLNWFAKIDVIKWHRVPKGRLLVIAGLWLVSIALYLYDYTLGFHALFLLSFIHVFLEFPLNHFTVLGIFKELGARLSAPRRYSH